MNQSHRGYYFENLITKVFQQSGFKVDNDAKIGIGRNDRVDMVLDKDGVLTWVELKIYRDEHVGFGTIEKAVFQISELLTLSNPGTKGLVVVSSYVSDNQKEEILRKFGISILDRSGIYHLINTIDDDKLLEDFEQLLLESKQGLDTKGVFDKVSNSNPFIKSDINNLFKTATPQRGANPPSDRGKTLCGELNAIPVGKSGWRQYEIKCIEILKYLFENELSNWNQQNTTDDELSRFDMVCSIKSQGAFWTTLIQSFQSRYILFEFKNYTDPIGQDQIYTTERYLYLRGLRSVGFIISRIGGKDQAWKAAKGALREHGKLIIILDNNNLCKMLEMKDNGLIPSDHLADLLDDFLISLSR